MLSPFALLLLLAGTAAFAAAAAGSLASPEGEAAIMLRLRATQPDPELLHTQHVSGWRPDSQAPHCLWDGIECDSSGRVVEIAVMAIRATDDEYVGVGPGHAPPDSPLLPELARLPSLERLILELPMLRALPSGLPTEWWQPGAFPRLQRLLLVAPALTGGALPDLQPGLLPALTDLTLNLESLVATLPPSWGASPATLPGLGWLNLQLQVQGGLPPEWAAGFRNLIELRVEGTAAQWRNCRGLPARPAAAPVGAQQEEVGSPGHEEQHSDYSRAGGGGEQEQQPQSPPGRQQQEQREEQKIMEESAQQQLPGLPPGWAAGFPALQSMRLVGLQLGGGLPPSWLAPGAFPALLHLNLIGCGLSGALPADLFRRVPAPETVELGGNCFSGALPEQWAASRAAILSVTRNALTGPAFPPAWLESGALQSLAMLLLGGNPGLTGTLPAQLAWPHLQQLEVWSTGVQGSIPGEWCQAPFAQHLTRLWIADTQLSGKLPRCANASMPQLEVMYWEPGTATMPPELPGLTGVGGAGAPPVRPRLAAGLGVLLVAAAAAVAATLMLRRGARQSRAGSERRPLLLRGQQGRLPQGRRGASIPAARHAQLAALLRPLAGSPDSSGGGIEMLSVRRLPSGLTHQLHGADSGLPSSQAGVLLPAGLAAPSQAEGDEAPHPRGPRRLIVAAGGGDVATPRPWGLDSLSLQLHPEALQLVAGPDGQLVELGAGAYAVVYLGRLGGAHVAVKAFELDAGTDSGGIWREAAMLRQCSHQHVVPLLGVAVQGGALLLAMQLMRGGSLRSALLHAERRQEFGWWRRGLTAATQLASALSFLHARSVMHGDLSSSNVLLDERCNAFIGDLGVARFTGGGGALSAGAFCLTHAAPEQLLGQRCTLAADVYSLGILLIELTTGRAVLKRSDWRLPRPPDECSQTALELVEACIATDPQQRPSATEVLQRLQAEAAS